MNAEIKTRAYVVVEDAVKTSPNLDTIWKEEKEDNVQSVVGCVQIYSGKWQTSLSASSHSFYPFNKTLLTFTEQMSYNLIVGGPTVVSSLHVSYTESDETSRHKNKPAFSVSTLHPRINYVVGSPAKCAMESILCRRKNWKELLLHATITFFIAGIPESNDLFSVKRENCFTTACHICEVESEELEGLIVGPQKC